MAGSGARRTRRSSVLRLAVSPSVRPSRAPAAPPRARPTAVSRSASRTVLRAQGAATPGVGDPLLPLQIGIWDALLALLRPGAEPEALARALRAYTRSTGYFMAFGPEGALRPGLGGRAGEPVSEEHRTGAVKAVQGRRTRSSEQKRVGDAAA